MILFSIEWHCPNLHIMLNIVVVVVIILIAMLIFYIVKKTTNGLKVKYKLESYSFDVQGFKCMIKPNSKVAQIAYAFWVELQTRKLGLPIDLENDVIVEVYDSWYRFFSITRELIKNIPADEVRGEDTQRLIELALKVLNEIIRPHLTRWQAKFKNWYDNEKKKDMDLTPQQIQQRFVISDKDNYEALSQDLRRVNDVLIKYRKDLELLVFDKVITNEISFACTATQKNEKIITNI